MLLRLIGLTALVVVLATPLPAAAGELPQLSLSGILGALDDPVLPDEWGGIWDIDIDLRLCGSPTILFSDSETDTLCPGASVDAGDSDPDDPTIIMECTGTATATRLEMTCTFSQVVEGGACTINSVITYEADLNGDSYTAVVRSESTVSGTCIDQGDFCGESTITGTRVGPAPASCATPVELSTWGTLKSRYE